MILPYLPYHLPERNGACHEPAFGVAAGYGWTDVDWGFAEDIFYGFVGWDFALWSMPWWMIYRWKDAVVDGLGRGGKLTEVTASRN